MKREAHKIEKKFPLLFTVGSFIFLYILQYVGIQLLFPPDTAIFYPLKDWIYAYLFVISSSAVFLFALNVGLSGSQVMVSGSVDNLTFRKPALWVVLVVFVFFASWSYLMVQLKVGMTIYADFDPLPFRLVGLLFYGRLFVQPFVLMYIAFSYQGSHRRWFVLILIMCLGAWVSLSSGSRFISIMFSLPLLLLFTGKSRWIIWILAVSFFIIISTLARHFYLPFVIGSEYIEIYANEQYQSAIVENLWMISLAYLFSRTMGINELLLTLSYGDITNTLGGALQRLFSVFVPFVPPGDGASVKSVYGLDDDVFGGFGLDLLSNYWLMYGGTISTYLGGILFTGWLLGKTYRTWAKIFLKLGGKEYLPFVFTLLFIIIFEGRSSLLPYILIAGYFANQPISLRVFRTFVRIVFSGQSQRSPISNHRQTSDYSTLLRSGL